MKQKGRCPNLLDVRSYLTLPYSPFNQNLVEGTPIWFHQTQYNNDLLPSQILRRDSSLYMVYPVMALLCTIIGV